MKNLLILVLIPFLLLAGCSHKGKSQPKAVKGVLDLQDWNFEQDGIINLDGEWEFYWKEFPVGESLELPEDKKDFIQVPRAWNGHIVRRTTDTGGVNEEVLSGEGYATYRLKVLLKEGMDLGIRVPDVDTSYELYVNKIKIISSGKIGTSAENSIPEISIYYRYFSNPQNEIDILITITNFKTTNSGIVKSIEFGKSNTINKLSYLNISRDLFISGILFIMGIYHISLYGLNRINSSPLYFGIFCLLLLVRTLIKGEIFLQTLLLDLTFSWNYTIEYCALYIGLPVFIAFLYSLFPNDMNKNINQVINNISLILVFFVLFSSPLYFTKTLTFFQLLILFSIIYAIYIIIKAISQEREGSKIFLSGFIIFSISMINDILQENNIINTDHYAPAGLVAFIFFQSYLLSSRFSKAFTDAKEARRNAEEQKQLVQTAKEEIERLNRTKDEFLANLSHEIKTPLVTIYGYSEMITLEEDLPESTKEYGREIYKSAGHLNSYMDDVLLVTDLETNLQLDKKPILFSDLLKDSLHTLEPLLQEKNIIPEVYDPTCITINCDSLLFGRALSNLLKNGIVYNRTGGTLKIRAEKTEKDIQFSIVDSGIGIPSEYHGKIFEKFFRIDSSLSYEISGVGLGLFLAKKILDLHGGSIAVHSEVGKGSEFLVLLPFS